MKWLPVLLLFGCETNEVRAWDARRGELLMRLQALQELPEKGDQERVAAFRESLDVPAFIRDRKIAARVFVDPAAVHIFVSGSAKECREALNALAALRWLTQEWRLRLEKGHCEWDTRTGNDFATLKAALEAPPPIWIAPPPERLSKGFKALKTSTLQLEFAVKAREERLGGFSMLEGKLDAVQPLLDSMHARPAPCDLAVIDRELALDVADQGKLLEVERDRLIDPLEPRADFRLRGLVENHDGTLVWRCEAL